MAIAAAIFDLDGTLVNSREAVVDAVAEGVRRVLAGYNIEGIEPDRVAIEDAMGLPPKPYYQRILPENLLHLADQVQEAATELEIEALKAGNGQLYPGVADTLKQLRVEGLKLGIISNAQAPYFRACLGELGLESLVDHSECHDELPPGVGMGKPILLQRALRALETAPHQAVMVGDRHDDVAAAHQLGCVKVGMGYGFGDPAELVEANVVIDRFEDLPAVIRGLGLEIP